MSNCISQDKNLVLGVVAAGAALIVAISYVLFGPEAWRGRTPKCTGLINLGNTCFVNAVIQGLASLSPVLEWLGKCHQRCQGKLTAALHSLLQDMSDGVQLEIAPRQVVDGLLAHGWVVGNQQQDALELFNILLSTIEEETVEEMNSLSDLQTLLMESTQSKSVLTKLGRTTPPSHPPHCPLRGLLMSTLTCHQCRHSLPTKYEYFNCLSLPLKQMHFGQTHLETCLSNFMSLELVTGVECPNCTKFSTSKKNFEKKLLIGRLPTCLSIHLVRTVWLSDGSISKNHSHLEFPMLLDVGKFMAHSDQNSHTYKLYAVIEHLGGPHSGHYCTYRRHGNHWIYTSDTLVYPVSTKEVMKCQAYMLFYQRISNCFNFGTDNS